MKVVINSCYGGFSISKKAAEFMAKRGNKRAIAELEKSKNGKNKGRWFGYGCVDGFDGQYDRSDSDLIAAVEELGSEKASGTFAELKVVEIPDGIEYEISSYDGIEHISEVHRTWR